VIQNLRFLLNRTLLKRVRLAKCSELRYKTTMNISGVAKNKKFVAFVSVIALLGMFTSVSAQADDDRNKKDDRSKRVIELDNPSRVVITPSATSLAITFSRVANASSYTVRVFQGTSGDRLVGSPRTMFNPGNSVTGLTPATDYRVSVQAIGNKTKYSNSEDPRKIRTRTTGNVITSYIVDWAPACAGKTPPNCIERTGGTRSYTPGQQLVPPTLPEQVGFTFTGWRSSNPAVAPTDTSTPVAPFGDLVFFPQWTPIDYSVIWSTNCPVQTPGACTDAIGGYSIYLLTNLINAPSTAPTVPGWTFVRWSSNNPNVSSTSFPTRAVSPFGDVEFTAEWGPNISHDVSWDLNCPDNNPCGSSEGGSGYYIEGLGITGPTSNPSVTGWTFTGWTSSNPNVSAANFPTTPVSTFGGVRFTAQWVSNTRNIFWIDNCPTPSDCTPSSGGQTTYILGEAIATFPTPPSNGGWGFSGWRPEFEPNGDMTNTAVWVQDTPPGDGGGGPGDPNNGGGPGDPGNGGGGPEPDPGSGAFTFTFNYDCIACGEGGTSSSSRTFNAGDSIGSFPAVPQYADSREFAGWLWSEDPMNNGSLTEAELLAIGWNGNATFTAQWSFYNEFTP